jgi:hypothetical protein
LAAGDTIAVDAHTMTIACHKHYSTPNNNGALIHSHIHTRQVSRLTDRHEAGATNQAH